MSDRLRFRVDPRDVPAEKAARLLHLSLAEFQVKLEELLVRGFPPPDPTTGMYDLEAMHRWCSSRNAHLFLTAPTQARDARSVVKARLGGFRRG